jgi:probable rRNA maturation factor
VTHPIEVEVYDHQERHSVDLDWLLVKINAAVPLVQPHAGPEPSMLAGLSLVEFSLLDDDAIAQVHADFLNDPTPTDVITFHHGEVLISLDTAERQASAHGQTFAAEVLLYAIHGLLHLHGHEDASSGGAQQMKLLQESILAQVMAQNPRL